MAFAPAPTARADLHCADPGAALRFPTDAFGFRARGESLFRAYRSAG